MPCRSVYESSDLETPRTSLASSRLFSRPSVPQRRRGFLNATENRDPDDVALIESRPSPEPDILCDVEARIVKALSQAAPLRADFLTFPGAKSRSSHAHGASTSASGDTLGGAAGDRRNFTLSGGQQTKSDRRARRHGSRA